MFAYQIAEKIATDQAAIGLAAVVAAAGSEVALVCVRDLPVAASCSEAVVDTAGDIKTAVNSGIAVVAVGGGPVAFLEFASGNWQKDWRAPPAPLNSLLSFVKSQTYFAC